MSNLSQTHSPQHLPDRRTGADFTDAILREAACQAIVDSLRSEGPLAPAGSGDRHN
ncbi:hypothetical protein [Cereibacter sediminicola]|uniref:hypothetical protein n=1 Tax=Cereibacter sediminicola TaxID=2584941 RepID=UPI0016429153|nr:hypothetical protein [Cereibacter sediminicola]